MHHLAGLGPLPPASSGALPAFQGLYLFVAWLMNAWVVRPLCYLSPHLPFDKMVGLALLIMSVFMMIKASHDEAYSLPLFGELAQRSVAES